MHETEPGSENPAGPVHAKVGDAALVDTHTWLVSPRQIGERPTMVQVGSGFTTSVRPQVSEQPVTPSVTLTV